MGVPTSQRLVHLVFLYVVIFSYLVMHQEIPSKDHLTKNGFSNNLFPIYHHLKAMKHSFFKCQFTKSYWKFLQDQYLALLHAMVRWCATLLRD